VRWSHRVLRIALGRRLPRTSGVLGVRRDRWGIPIIEAAADSEAWFGLGFCHAQDRATQLDFFRRAAAGTLSELVGKEGSAVDRLARRVGFRRAAHAQMRVLAPDVLAMLEAYARGVSAGFAFGLTRKPHEFAIFGGEPAPWDAVDVCAFLKFLSFLLPAHWNVELARLQVLLADGPEALLALDPSLTAQGPAIDPRPGPDQWRAFEHVSADIAGFLRLVPAGRGSNSWVLAGSKTASGRPLLANDPHMMPTLPAPWYFAHLRTPEWAACGATLPGAPCMVAGHNGFAAWGCTAGLQDDTDLHVEELGPDGRSVREPDGSFARCAVRRDVIRVKGGTDVVEEVLITSRGPIISPALEGITTAVSMRAVWLDPLPARGLVDVHKARSFEEFRNAFREWPVIPQHMVYADTTGKIGWQLTGQVPVRQGSRGTLPRAGSDPEAAWDGLVPFERMPQAEDPECGFFVTANNPPVREPDASFLGYDWVSGYRAAVIGEALAPHAEWDVAACLQLQLSRRSKPWEETREVILAAPATDRDGRRALDLLRTWDGNVEADSPDASVYVFLFCELCQRVARAKAPKGWEWALGKGFGKLVPHSLFADRRFEHLVQLLRDQPDGWFARSWPEEIADALGAAIRWLERESGRRAEESAWGEVRPYTLKHMLLGEIPALNRAFNVGPVPGGGDTNTPFQATVVPLDPIELWQHGEGVPIPWTSEEIAAATVETLVLDPIP
jgi:penicillin amidase